MAATEEELWKDVLGSYADEYKDLSDTWKQVETKAQSVTAIAGIFLAATFAWARDLPAEFHAFDRTVLCLGMLILFSSILMAILAMRVQRTTMPPHGETRREIVDGIASRGYTTTMTAYYQTLIASWDGANAELHLAIEYKAETAHIAQKLLAFAAGICLTLAIHAVAGNFP